MDNKIQLIMFVIVVIMVGLIALETIYIFKQNRIIRFLKSKTARQDIDKINIYWEDEEQDKLALLKKKMELNTLQSQINPHFLYNTLDSIRSKALIEGQKEIADMTEVLARFFRYCIGNKEKLVKLREELAHIEDYFYIQKFRFEDRFELSIEVKQEDIYDYYVPRMTLQPIVENAMLHGLERVNRKGILKILLDRTEEYLLITVSDNGYGMNEQELISLNSKLGTTGIKISISGKHNGIAIVNVNARLKLTFGEEYGIYYRSMAYIGTDAEIRIPIVDDFNRIYYEDRI